MSEMLSAALAQAVAGVPVFPCNPSTKAPLVEGGFQSATTDEDVIRRWWEKWPSAMIGMPTGAVTGIFVLDIDIKDGYSGFVSLFTVEGTYQSLPVTKTVTTPSRGEHRYFKYPADIEVKCSTSKVGRCLDIRGQSGYVIIPPSRNAAGKCYEESPADIADAPDWLINLILGRGISSFEKKVRNATTNIRQAESGTRNETLNREAFQIALAIGDGEGEVLVAHSALSAAAAEIGLDATEIERTLRSAFSAGLAKAAQSSGIKPGQPADLKLETISDDEWATSRLTPDCIVANLLYAEVALLFAAGGMGKTTLLLHIAIHIILGRRLFDLEVIKPGSFVLVTAEDTRELLIARARRICEALNLSDSEIQLVRNGLLILDVTSGAIKLSKMESDVVRVDYVAADKIIELSRPYQPVAVSFDPAISFGVGEHKVNDAEQGLIEAARTIRSALSCCVLYVHHTGKENARNKTVDQYSGRGGSAFSDGARMVFVLNWADQLEWSKRTGQELMPGQTGLVLSRPKLSFASRQEDILIRREGFEFIAIECSSASVNKLDCAEAVLALVTSKFGSGGFPTQNVIEEELSSTYGREAVRKVVRSLLANGDVVQRPVSKPGQRGTRTYLAPALPLATVEVPTRSAPSLWGSEVATPPL